MVFKKDCFADKLFLITGASSGMGAHISKTLISLGAKVLGIGRSQEKLQQIQSSCINPQSFIVLPKDISQNEGLDKWVLELAKQYGSIDGAVLSVESAKHLFETNYFGNLQVIKGLIDRRVKTPKGASFVILSSNSSVRAQKGLANYSATKGAINTAIKSIALEIAPLSYRINAISPGFVMTEMIEEWSKIYDEEYIQNIKKEYPLGIGNVEQITPLVCFLLSKDSSWITGQNIVIDGGASL